MNNVSCINCKEKCCGCTVCKDICPTNAITLKEDEEGFIYPDIDIKKCINCGKCLKVCPIRNIKNVWNQYETPIAYAAKHNIEKVRLASRSGGVFTAISDYILSLNGVIYGAILLDDFKCIHYRATTNEERDKMRGSKYVQSNMNGILNDVITDLKNDLWVLFSGTSCQVQAIRQAIPIKLQEKLILVDIICHGVPSPKVWADYLKYNEKLYNGKITNVDFRNKIKYGWRDHVETISVDNEEHDSKIYTNLFYNHVIIRPSCFECPYKSLVKPGDITIADCWGIDNAIDNFNDDKGVSLVLINNDKGKSIIDKSKKDIVFEKIDLEKCMQPPLRGNFVKPVMRKKFWKIYKKKGFEAAIQIYGKRKELSLFDKISRKIQKNILKKNIV